MIKSFIIELFMKNEIVPVNTKIFTDKLEHSFEKNQEILSSVNTSLIILI